LSTDTGKIDWTKPEKLSNQRIKIVDSREPETIRMKLLEHGWTQSQLYSGDYLFMTGDYKKVTVTRKTVDDLMGSIGDRFSKQLEEIIDQTDQMIILLEGSWKMINPSNNIITGHGVSYNTWSMVWNYLRRWQDKGFTVEITVNEGHTIQRLDELFALYQKTYSMSAKSNEWEDDRILAFPSGSRGKTAKATLDEFGSLRNVANANAQELLDRMQGKNVGVKKAQLIYSHFHRGEDEKSDDSQAVLL
jgi:ERCC4-type nuclease